MLLKLTSVVAAAFALLASGVCHSFVDRHAQPATSGANDGFVDYRQRFNGLLQHLWYAEQIRSEQARLADLRAQRKALEAAILQRESELSPVSPVAYSHRHKELQCGLASAVNRCLVVRRLPIPVMGAHRLYVGTFCRVWINWRQVGC
ncbi:MULTISPECIES: hypothetical protein [unclassified Serratia (in: enterobacteria)]|uniref:hypothetical protein n=1 Tax=unclassified Serratia (in: enterobacteria) TaxID=2647522 RepID=UPI002ED30025|nr:hypothetical protein [Serratia sp. C2(2)]MEE4447030.1 hypothetical protein [Serratia sp. C2(1)]